MPKMTMVWGKEMGDWKPSSRPSSGLIFCGIPGKCLSFSVPQFPQISKAGIGRSLSEHESPCLLGWAEAVVAQTLAVLRNRNLGS